MKSLVNKDVEPAPVDPAAPVPSASPASPSRQASEHGTAAAHAGNWFVALHYGLVVAEAVKETDQRIYFGTPRKAWGRSQREVYPFVEKSRLIARDLSKETADAIQAIYARHAEAAVDTRREMNRKLTEIEEARTAEIAAALAKALAETSRG